MTHAFKGAMILLLPATKISPIVGNQHANFHKGEVHFAWRRVKVRVQVKGQSDETLLQGPFTFKAACKKIASTMMTDLNDSTRPLKPHVLRLQPGVDLKATLQTYCHSNFLEAGFIISAIGSLSRLKIRLANSATFLEKN